MSSNESRVFVYGCETNRIIRDLAYEGGLGTTDSAFVFNSADFFVVHTAFSGFMIMPKF